MSRPLVTITDSVDATRALAGALAELARPGDLLLLVGDLGAGKTAFTQGFGAGLGIDDQITSPTFALVQGYTGRLDLHHLDVYRLEQINEALDLGLSELLDDGSVTLIEWGDTITSALPRDYLEVRITFGEGEDDRRLELTPVGSQWQARVRAMSVAVAAWVAVRRRRSSRRVLILGIESSTVQIGCAIGGHEGVLASAHSAKGKRHAENLTPAIEFICAQAQVTLSEIGLVAVDVGPGLFTGLRVGIATAKAIAFALRVPMIGVSSLDLLAFPVRFTPRLIVAAIDARRGEIFYAFYRQVPGGVQRISEHAVGSPDDLASELLATGEEALLVGDGAHRYREDFDGLARVEIVDPGNSFPSAASLVQLAHAQALREDYRQIDEISPIYLRRPDAEINWTTRDSA